MRLYQQFWIPFIFIFFCKITTENKRKFNDRLKLAAENKTKYIFQVYFQFHLFYISHLIKTGGGLSWAFKSNGFGITLMLLNSGLNN
jgi:hypothetical protein